MLESLFGGILARRQATFFLQLRFAVPLPVDEAGRRRRRRERWKSWAGGVGLTCSALSPRGFPPPSSVAAKHTQTTKGRRYTHFRYRPSASLYIFFASLTRTRVNNSQSTPRSATTASGGSITIAPLFPLCPQKTPLFFRRKRAFSLVPFSAQVKSAGYFFSRTCLFLQHFSGAGAFYFFFPVLQATSSS